MSATAWILTAGFATLVVLGVPFAFAIMLAVIAVLLVVGIEPMLLPQTLVAGTQSFSLLAIPFFMLAGELMLAGGLSQRLVRMAEVFVQHLPGGMGLVVVLAALVFSAVSGSAPATTAAIGAVMIPAMVERGHSRAYATALVVSAGVLAPLVPPSIAFVIWGVIAEQSISRLFLSGVVPGLLMASGMAALIVGKALRERGRSGRVAPRASWAERRAALREGIWALLAPAVVLGGIYGGAFTPTEAAVVVCVYALLVGLVIERRLNWRELPRIVGRAMSVSAVVMAIVAVSNGFGFLVAQEQLAPKLAAWLATHFDSRWSMLLALNLGFFALAAVMDEIAIMVILGPMLIGIANQFGVDPIHFGAMIVTNVAIGMAMPPIGYCLFVGMAIGGVGLAPLARAIAPFVAMMVGVLMLVTFWPALALAFVR